MSGRVKLSDDVRANAWTAMQVLTRDHGSFLPRTVADIVAPRLHEGLYLWARWLASEQVLAETALAGEPLRFSVTIVGECPPSGRPPVGRFGRAQHQMWRAIRTLRRFTLAELRESASTEEVPVSREAAQAYAQALLDVGYLVAAGETGAAGYRLSSKADTGPRPPILLESGIFDLNLGRTVNVTRLEARP